MTRFYVERTRDNFEDVGAEVIKITHGSLIFLNTDADGNETLAVAYAPGQWLTVVEEPE